MKMSRPTVTAPDLDSPAVQAYLEGSATSLPPEEQKTKKQHSPAKESAINAKANKKELIIPDSIVIDKNAIGKFLVDMPKSLRQRIKQKSLDTGKSMNELIITVLSQAFG